MLWGKYSPSSTKASGAAVVGTPFVIETEGIAWRMQITKKYLQVVSTGDSECTDNELVTRHSIHECHVLHSSDSRNTLTGKARDPPIRKFESARRWRECCVEKTAVLQKLT
jgi:hypothetical protein